MKKIYLFLHLSLAPILVNAQQSLQINPQVKIFSSTTNSIEIEGFYISDKMFDFAEEKYILKKFDDIESLNKYINTHTNFHVPCFEFKAENNFFIKRVRSKKCKNRNAKFGTLVSAIKWEKLEQNTYVLHTRINYYRTKKIMTEKAIYSLEKENNNYILKKQQVLESYACP